MERYTVIIPDRVTRISVAVTSMPLRDYLSFHHSSCISNSVTGLATEKEAVVDGKLFFDTINNSTAANKCISISHNNVLDINAHTIVIDEIGAGSTSMQIGSSLSATHTTAYRSISEMDDLELHYLDDINIEDIDYIEYEG